MNDVSGCSETVSPAAFFAQSVNINGKSVKFEIWDTAGQERYASPETATMYPQSFPFCIPAFKAWFRCITEERLLQLLCTM